MNDELLKELEWRGLIADSTHPEELDKKLQEGEITLYCGFDPTADSLHVGSLIPLLTLKRFQLAGHHPIALAGGATGMIGDPSGKAAERTLLDTETLNKNVDGIREQLCKILDFNCWNKAIVLDNSSWTSSFTFLDFLRDIGKFFSVNQMLTKESVRARLEDRDTGISYTEFSYMLLQAYDFLHLRSHNNCVLQIGGSDQWGNITAGIDLIRKKSAGEAFGLTLPLLTNADGSKFGKTVDGAIWLDSNKTSVYKFYQFWMQVDDRDVIRFLKLFTFLSKNEIDDLERLHQSNPGKREAHTVLAQSMTDMIHGQDARIGAERASNVLFGGSVDELTEEDFLNLSEEIPFFNLPSGVSLVEALLLSHLSSSKGQARKDIEGGGISVNNIQVLKDDIKRNLVCEESYFGRYMLLRKGKKNYALICLR